MTVHFSPTRFSFSQASTRDAHRPRVAVVDNFTQKVADIDGDGVPDLAHGTLVERILRAYLPNVEVIPFALGTAIVNDWDCNEVTGQLQELIARIRRGEAFDAINLSLAAHLPIRKLASDALPLRRENLHRFREQMLQWVKTNAQSLRDPGVGGTLATLQELLSLKVPTFIGGGNDGQDYFNVYGIPKGSIHVGALNASAAPGIPARKAPYTADNSLISAFAQGTYNVTKVDGGYDIDGDGRPEVADTEVSGGKNPLQEIIRPFIGQPLVEMLVKENELAELHHALVVDHISPARIPFMATRVFSLDRMKELGWLDEEHYQSLRETGDYAVFHDGRIRTALRTDPAGNLIYSPDGSRKRHAQHFILGTSIATPTQIGLTLRARSS